MQHIVVLSIDSGDPSLTDFHHGLLSRIQQKIYCPVDDAIIDRSELVRGYEVEEGTLRHLHR